MSAKNIILGPSDSYDYASLCMPSLPWTKKEKKPKLQFYSKDEPLPLLLSLIMGLQHAFAMVGGLITPVSARNLLVKLTIQ